MNNFRLLSISYLDGIWSTVKVPLIPSGVGATGPLVLDCFCIISFRKFHGIEYTAPLISS
jgi:hypothetical protein